MYIYRYTPITCTYIHTQTYIHTYTHVPRIIAHWQNINSIQVFAKKKNRAFPPPLIHKLMGWFAFFFFYPCVPDKTKCMVKPQNYIFFSLQILWRHQALLITIGVYKYRNIFLPFTYIYIYIYILYCIFFAWITYLWNLWSLSIYFLPQLVFQHSHIFKMWGMHTAGNNGLCHRTCFCFSNCTNPLLFIWSKLFLVKHSSQASYTFYTVNP